MTEIFLHLTVVLEMIVTNIVFVEHYSKRKYKWYVDAIVLSIFTALIVGSLMLGLQRIKMYGNGNGLFLVFGFVYLIPLALLFDQKVSQTFMLMIMIWSFTAFPFAVGVQISYLSSFLTEHLSLSVLIFQTVYYLITIPLFVRFIEPSIRIFVNNIHGKMKVLFSAFATILYLTVVIINCALITQIKVLDFLSILILSLCLIFGFYFAIKLVDSILENRKFSYATYHDFLTGLENRYSFAETYSQLQKESNNFCFVFLDLDDFKKINDDFGHITGDEYLKLFSEKLKQRFETDKVFRMHGDEFALISNQTQAVIEEKIIIMEKELPEMFKSRLNLDFLGFSYGISESMPDDTLDSILYRADALMYCQKGVKKGIKYPPPAKIPNRCYQRKKPRRNNKTEPGLFGF